RTEAALEEERSARERLQSTGLDPAKAKRDEEARERQRHSGKFVFGQHGIVRFAEGPQQVAPRARAEAEAGPEFAGQSSQMQQLLRLQQQQLEQLKKLGVNVNVNVDDKKTVSVERSAN